MNVRTDRKTDRQTDRQTDRPHELHVYVGLAQARPNNSHCYNKSEVKITVGHQPFSGQSRTVAARFPCLSSG